MNSGLNKKLFFYGLGLYGAATAAAFLYVKSSQGSEELDENGIDKENLASDEHRQHVFNSIAKSYDQEIGMDETLMGLNLLRRWHLSKASGQVLEVASGTGRNFSYYSKDCQVTATDACPNMVKQALLKAKNLGKGSAKVVGVGVMDATKLSFNAESFDTVVDTHGLCSVDKPQQMLEEMCRVCKKDGQILLLEHGRSHYSWLNNLLDKYAHRHLQKWGCSWNRNIAELVKDSGIEIQDISRFHFGTSYMIVGKPKNKRMKEAEKRTAAS